MLTVASSSPPQRRGGTRSSQAQRGLDGRTREALGPGRRVEKWRDLQSQKKSTVSCYWWGRSCGHRTATAQFSQGCPTFGRFHDKGQLQAPSGSSFKITVVFLFSPEVPASTCVRQAGGLLLSICSGGWGWGPAGGRGLHLFKLSVITPSFSGLRDTAGPLFPGSRPVC